MTKAYRQARIQKLVRAGSVGTQQDLVRLLKSAGIRTSQVTLSRDLRELGVIKTPHGYREQASLGSPDTGPNNLARVLREFVRDIQVADSLVVLKTLPGGAAAVGEALDMEAGWGIAGTVAGDNTIFAATAGPAQAKRLCGKLRRAWANEGS
ncbi:MAG: ArgR family transcriptional regulator [Acidobacteria bacterium]|nr:ArgR family transcriptional regulator [Acidobacteriota bacterium]